MTDEADAITRAVEAVSRIDAVPTLLAVVCEATGMRFAAVAHITDSRWTACAVRDDIPLGLRPGEGLAVNPTLCFESRSSRAPILVEHASVDAHYRTAHLPAVYPIESYIAVPIVLAKNRYFGSLCALDPSPAKLGEPRIVSMFSRFAALIATQLEHLSRLEQEHSALLYERATGELREQFIAILGHDLRNPLQAVFATADQLERKLAYPAHAELASRIKSSARRMSSLIDDVLDFARGRLGGGIGIDLTEVADINAGLQRVIREVEDAQPDCRIVSDIRVGRPVRCDLGRLQQVAANLLANALTHGAPHSAVRITARDDDRDLILEVWNAGEPIPAENLGRIFEPYWRNSAADSHNGLGLGLHICAQILRAHAGRISVTSTIEAGTQFTARLPLGAPRTTEPHPDLATRSAEPRFRQSRPEGPPSTSL